MKAIANGLRRYHKCSIHLRKPSSLLTIIDFFIPSEYRTYFVTMHPSSSFWTWRNLVICPFLINFNSVCLIFIWLIIIIICPKWRDLLKVSTEFGPVSMCAGQLKGVRCGWYRFGRGSVRVFWSCPLFDPLSKPGLNFTFGIKETIVT